METSEALQDAKKASDDAYEAWRVQSIEVRCMGDDNGGWGTDAEYRAAARKRDALWLEYENAWRAYAECLNADVGRELLDPSRAYVPRRRS